MGPKQRPLWGRAVPPKKYEAIPPKPKKKKKKEASPAAMHKRSQPIVRKRYVPAIVKPSADRDWKCSAGSGVILLNIDTKDYYGPLMTAEMREELDLRLNSRDEIQIRDEGKQPCLSSDEAGPHAGMHCGLRHLLHLRRQAGTVQQSGPCEQSGA